MSNSGCAGSPVESSIDAPTMPVVAASAYVSATPSGVVA
jgi:hypothetical protein